MKKIVFIGAFVLLGLINLCQAQDWYNSASTNSFNIVAGTLGELPGDLPVKMVMFKPIYESGVMESSYIPCALKKYLQTDRFQYWKCSTPENKSFIGAIVAPTYNLMKYPKTIEENSETKKIWRQGHALLYFTKNGSDIVSHPTFFVEQPLFGLYDIGPKYNIPTMVIADTLAGAYIYSNSPNFMSVQNVYSAKPISHFNIDRDTQKGGSDFELTSASFMPITAGYKTVGNIVYESAGYYKTYEDNNAVNKKIILLQMVCGKSKGSDHYFQCMTDSNNKFFAAIVGVTFKDDKGVLQYCQFIYNWRGPEKNGTFCTNNPTFGVYPNGSHHDTLNIGYSSKNHQQYVKDL